MNLVNIDDLATERLTPPGSSTWVSVKLPFPELQGGQVDPHWMRSSDRDYLLVVPTYPAGGTAGYHLHTDTEEIYVVLSGRAKVTVDSETRDLGPGDILLTKSGSRHQLHDITEDLTYIAVEIRRSPSAEAAAPKWD
jgi:mannose-6-phosphate isomerase-like protein (cupin superfamily)